MEFKTHIRVEDLNVFYDKNQALKNITVDFPDKKITAIIGPSGLRQDYAFEVPKPPNRYPGWSEGIRQSFG